MPAIHCRWTPGNSEYRVATMCYARAIRTNVHSSTRRTGYPTLRMRFTATAVCTRAVYGQNEWMMVRENESTDCSLAGCLTTSYDFGLASDHWTHAPWMIVPKLRQPHMDILGAVYVNPKGTKHEPPNVAMKPWLHRSNVVTLDTRPIALERTANQIKWLHQMMVLTSINKIQSSWTFSIMIMPMDTRTWSLTCFDRRTIKLHKDDHLLPRLQLTTIGRATVVWCLARFLWFTLFSYWRNLKQRKLRIISVLQSCAQLDQNKHQQYWLIDFKCPNSAGGEGHVDISAWMRVTLAIWQSGWRWGLVSTRLANWTRSITRSN